MYIKCYTLESTSIGSSFIITVAFIITTSFTVIAIVHVSTRTVHDVFQSSRSESETSLSWLTLIHCLSYFYLHYLLSCACWHITTTKTSTACDYPLLALIIYLQQVVMHPVLYPLFYECFTFLSCFITVQPSVCLHQSASIHSYPKVDSVCYFYLPVSIRLVPTVIISSVSSSSSSTDGIISSYFIMPHTLNCSQVL